jgi:hypothetical protein
VKKRRTARRRASRPTNSGPREDEECGDPGQHRAYVTDFIRDARAGGCAVGVPPDNLGFRLVREPRSWDLQPRENTAYCAQLGDIARS